MIPQPPPGQGPIDPQAAFRPPDAPPGPPPGAAPVAGLNAPPVGVPGPAAGASSVANAAPAPQSISQPVPRPAYAPAPPPTMSSTVPHMTNPTPHGMPSGIPPGMYPTHMMPPMMPYPYPPPQPPRRSGVVRAMFMSLLIFLLVGSVLLNLILLIASVGGEGAGIQQTVQAGGGKDKIVVVPLRGIIETNLSAQFDRFLDMAEADKNVKALVVEIDSPGGTVTASDEIYNRLKQFKAKKPIPIVVSMGSIATSGGYYAACGGDYVFAQPTTFTGNIGVLMPRYNFHRLMEKYGVEETTIVSTGATYKNAGSSFRPETPEEKQYMQELADSAFTRFKDVVNQGRSSKLKANLEDVANGKVFTAPTALNMGLIDQVGYLDDAQAYATTAAGLSNPTVVRYQDPPTFMDLLMASRSNIASAVAGGGADGKGGVTINVDPNLIHELSTPRPLYLWRGQ